MNYRSQEKNAPSLISGEIRYGQLKFTFGNRADPAADPRKRRLILPRASRMSTEQAERFMIKAISVLVVKLLMITRIWVCPSVGFSIGRQYRIDEGGPALRIRQGREK